jgi:hypothetical protein
MGYIGGSCMSEKPANYFDLYHNIGTRVVYIHGSARALLHTCIRMDTGEELEILDRIFYDNELDKLTIQAWRKEQAGMNRFQHLDGVPIRSKRPINSTYEAVPYVDTLYSVRQIEGNMYLCNSSVQTGTYIDKLQGTEGESCDCTISEGEGGEVVYCVDSDVRVPIDDAYYCESDGNYYESGEFMWHFDGNGFLHIEDDDRIAHNEDTGDYDFKDNMNYCESEDIFTTSTSYIEVSEGELEGSFEHVDTLVYCDDIDGYVAEDDDTFYVEDTEQRFFFMDEIFEHEDGKYYSYEEEEVEEDS